MDYKLLDETLNYLNNITILEFNMSNIIYSIKQTIIRLIEKIQKLLDKCNNSNLKSGINQLLNKAKKSLDKTSSIENNNTEKMVKELEEEINNIKFEYGKFAVLTNNVNEIVYKYCTRDDIYATRSTLARIAYTMHDKEDLEMFIGSLQYAKDTFGSDLFQEDDNIDFEEYDYRKIAEILSNNFSRIKCMSFIRRASKEFN